MLNSDPTVFIVDDDESVREALQFLIESVDLNVQTYDSAARFLDAFDPEATGCLVLDVRMPGMSGLELQENMATRQCGLPIIIVTGNADVAMCVRAFEGGAFAFLEKPINQQMLLEHIHRAIEQDQRNRTGGLPVQDVLARLEQLTAREREVMDLLLHGRSMKQIGRQLGISLPTCSKHRTRVLEKLEVENDVQLVRRMLEWKEVSRQQS
jgi:two-component system response regulator FixJ